MLTHPKQAQHRVRYHKLLHKGQYQTARISAIRRYISQKNPRNDWSRMSEYALHLRNSTLLLPQSLNVSPVICHFEAVSNPIIVSDKWYASIRTCLPCTSDAPKSSLFSLAQILKPDPCNDDIPRFWRDQGIYTRCLRALYHTFASYFDI